MIYSAKLKEALDTLRPEPRELSLGEILSIEYKYKQLSKHLGAGLPRDMYFSAQDGLQYNYAQPEENSRWSTVGEFPLVTEWDIQEINGKNVTFTSSIRFSGGEKDYAYHVNRFWKPDLTVKVLSEETIRVSPPSWLPLPKEGFMCFASEYSEIVDPYVKELMELSPIITV